MNDPKPEKTAVCLVTKSLSHQVTESPSHQRLAITHDYQSSPVPVQSQPGQESGQAADQETSVKAIFATLQNLIAKLAPKSTAGIADSIFELARLMLTFKNKVGRNPRHEEAGIAFDQWAIFSRPFWDPKHDRDYYYMEFIRACGIARFGLDEDPVAMAFLRAKSKPLPEIPGIKDERVRLLAAVCLELGGQEDGQTFYLPTRKVGKLLGVHYNTVAKWLRSLETLGIIKLAPGEVRKTRKKSDPSPHYVYLGLPPPELEIGPAGFRPALPTSRAR